MLRTAVLRSLRTAHEPHLAGSPAFAGCLRLARLESNLRDVLLFDFHLHLLALFHSLCIGGLERVFNVPARHFALCYIELAELRFDSKSRNPDAIAIRVELVK